MTMTVMIVEDESNLRKGFDILLRRDYQTLLAETGEKAVETAVRKNPDVVLLDIGLPDMSGLEVLREIRRQSPDSAVIMVTAEDSTRMIVQAMKDGAFDYLVKPVDQQEIQVTVQNALENRRLREQLKAIQRPNAERYRLDMISESPKMARIVDMAKKVVGSPDTPVLIVGESGVGKGMLARAVHYDAGVDAGPFVLVNCGAIAKDLVESELFGYERGAFTGARSDGKKGRMEEAADGTLFLDEIGAMPLDAQSKLLQVLEDRIFFKVGGTQQKDLNARVIAATNLNLEDAVQAGTFRADLYYRLNVVTLEIPPLRERREDILPLAHHFLHFFNTKLGRQFQRIAAEAEARMLRYDWPGNVRELRNVIERIAILEKGDTLLPGHLPFYSIADAAAGGQKSDIEAIENQFEEAAADVILSALRESGGNVTEAAKQMNLPVHKLRYRIKKLGIRL